MKDDYLSPLWYFAAADSGIILVQANYLPARGLDPLLKTVSRVKRQLSPKLNVDDTLLTMADNRTVLSREMFQIPRSVRAAEISTVAN